MTGHGNSVVTEILWLATGIVTRRWIMKVYWNKHKSTLASTVARTTQE